ncbi:NfeD family protein [Nigerium massiliense]|uniref:NfeD family protein n=1 Tax=Nigerium massiliense TaxID=1522317 RepID=UPI0005912CB2|nr:NfeD family protein [Nigerium massiliense]
MPQWWQENWWAIWFALAGVLAAAEMLTLDLTLLMLASGALAGGVVAIVLPGVLWAQVLVAVAVAFITLFLVRPMLRRRFQLSPGYRSSVDKMVGSEGTVTRQVTASGGEIKVNGEAWSARSYDGEDIEPGVVIEVFEVDGVTAVVYPRHRPLTGGSPS